MHTGHFLFECFIRSCFTPTKWVLPTSLTCLVIQLWWSGSQARKSNLTECLLHPDHFSSSVFFHPRCTTLSGPPETLIALQHHFPCSNSTILHYTTNWLSQYNHPSQILASPSLLAVTVRYKASPNTNSKLTVPHKHKARAHDWDVTSSVISMLFSSCTLMIGMSRHLCKFQKENIFKKFK